MFEVELSEWMFHSDSPSLMVSHGQVFWHAILFCLQLWKDHARPKHCFELSPKHRCDWLMLSSDRSYGAECLMQLLLQTGYLSDTISKFGRYFEFEVPAPLERSLELTRAFLSYVVLTLCLLVAVGAGRWMCYNRTRLICVSSSSHLPPSTRSKDRHVEYCSVMVP